mmetsp:Transcript_25738/g.79181  ORF Transcript_25738/g.79181 Transcript_25738/m.79181 type:complete len:300 (-) Transcript_25738:809-1708(-)
MKIVPMLFRIVCLVFVARRVCGGTVHVHHFTDKHIELNDAELVGDGSLLAKVNTQRTVLGCPRRALNGTILYGHGRGNAAGSYGPLPSAGTCKLAFCAVDGLSIALEWKNYENIPQPSTQAEKNELALRAFVRWRSRLINLGVDEIIVAWDPNDQGAFYDGSVASQWKSGDSRFRLGAPGDRRWAEADPMKAAVRDWVRSQTVLSSFALCTRLRALRSARTTTSRSWRRAPTRATERRGRRRTASPCARICRRTATTGTSCFGCSPTTATAPSWRRARSSSATTWGAPKDVRYGNATSS